MGANAIQCILDKGTKEKAKLFEYNLYLTIVSHDLCIQEVYRYFFNREIKFYHIKIFIILQR